MKVLLVNPSMNFKKYGKFSGFLEPVPCIGLAYIAAVLEKNNIEVEIIDAYAFRLSVEETLKTIKKKKPRIIGISCLTLPAPWVFGVVKGIKSWNPEILTVLGNTHASALAEDILRSEPVDVIVHGEGEWTMLELVKAIEKKQDFAQIEGISFKREGEIINTPPRELIEDLDNLPYPAWHLCPVEKYSFQPLGNIRKGPGLIVLASRGCLYECSFCSIFLTKYRIRNPRKIVEEIEFLLGNFPIKQIAFSDATFPVEKDFVLKFSKEMVRSGMNKKIVWFCQTRPDTVSKEVLVAMREAGCRRIGYGIETVEPQHLHQIGKSYSSGITRKNIRSTRESGIQSVGYFMLGLPGETKEMREATIKFAQEINLDIVKFAITVPYPESPLYENLPEEIKLKRRDWENYSPFNPEPEKLVCLPEMNPYELLSAQRKAHRSFYLRPKIIFRHLFKLRTLTLRELFLGFLNLVWP